ncbi:MAG: hypothetical protein OHK0029_04720 [Armatimonadaceae bacterium]
MIHSISTRRVGLTLLTVALLGMALLAGCSGDIRSDVADDVRKDMMKDGSGKPPVSQEQIQRARQGQGGAPR